MIRIAIIDDHPLVINGIKDMLSDTKHIKITETYLSGKTALNELQADKTDVLLLDIQMPDMRGEDVIKALKKTHPDLKVLVLTNFDNTLYAKSMITFGALGYLLKNTSKTDLIKAIETVADGKTFIVAEIREQLQTFDQRLKNNNQLKKGLTPREIDILRLLAAGKSNQQIAAELFLSKRTVENYRLNLTIKLDLKNTAALVKYAMEIGLTEN